MKRNKILPAFLLTAFILNMLLPATARAEEMVFDKIEILVPNGERVSEKSVRLRFLADELQIETTSDRKIFKTFKYADIKDAEYSYSKNPRWKTGLGLGAASIVFPPLLLIAIPLGFSKHRRHWLTFRTGDDFAVLKLSKSNRKLVMPAFETKTGVDIKGKGENK